MCHSRCSLKMSSLVCGAQNVMGWGLPPPFLSESQMAFPLRESRARRAHTLPACPRLEPVRTVSILHPLVEADPS